MNEQEKDPSSTPDRTNADTPATGEQMLGKSRGLQRAIAAAVLLVTVAVAWPILHDWLTHESTDDAFIDAPVVQISPQVPARVLRVHVEDNEDIASGTLLIELDSADYEVAVGRAQAALELAHAQAEQAQAAVHSAEANVGQAQAALHVAQATAENAQADLRRYENLYRSQSVSEQVVDAARTQARVSQAKVEQAERQVSAALAQVATARAAYLAAQAQEHVARTQLAQAQLQLSYTRICAPTAGRVTRKSVEPGQFVSVGQPMLALVGPSRWVVANFKETQLARVKPGQPAEIKVDAFPGERLTGRVDSLQAGTGSRFSLLPPENATGNFVKIVQRVPVKITFDPPLRADLASRLAAGMSVVPRVQTK